MTVDDRHITLNNGKLFQSSVREARNLGNPRETHVTGHMESEARAGLTPQKLDLLSFLLAFQVEDTIVGLSVTSQLFPLFLLLTSSPSSQYLNELLLTAFVYFLILQITYILFSISWLFSSSFPFQLKLSIISLSLVKEQ